MTPQLNFVYMDKHPANDSILNAPTVVQESMEAQYIEDGDLKNAFQRDETLLKIQLSSPDRRYLFTIYSLDQDKAKSILNNYSQFYKAYYMEDEL